MMPPSGDFHVPLGPESGHLPKIITDKATSARLITPYLRQDEIYAWDGPYNTRDFTLATRSGQSMGRLFITNQRMIFWSDDLPKPHVALRYEDIQSWKSTWMPLRSRGITMFVAGRKIIFAANATAIKNAERYLNWGWPE